MVPVPEQPRTSLGHTVEGTNYRDVISCSDVPRILKRKEVTPHSDEEVSDSSQGLGEVFKEVVK